MPNRSLSLLGVAALAAGLVLVPAAADAAPSARTYANCTAINRVYSGGIARKGVTHNRTPHGNRALQGHVKFDTALYKANAKSDRDHDGIACEKN